MQKQDWERARQETTHCGDGIHFNNAGASLPPDVVVETQIAFLRREAEIGGYEAEAEAHERLEGVYASIARLLSCDPDEIALTESATRAWGIAFYGLGLKSGDRILTSRAEYASNFLAFLQRAEQTGARIEVIPSDDSGQVDTEALRNMLDERVRLVAVTHVPTNSGLVNPAEEIGQVVKGSGALYLLDACQSIGQMPMDVRAIGCDFLSATGRKFLRAPRGTGFLYVRRDVMDEVTPPALDMHSAQWIASGSYRLRPDARRFEMFEANFAARLGLGTAVDYALSWGLDAIEQRVNILAETLRVGLLDLLDVTVQDIGARRCGIVTFTVRGHDPDTIFRELLARGIHVKTSPLYATRLDMEARGLDAVVRASVHYFNTAEEVARFCQTLEDVLQGGEKK